MLESDGEEVEAGIGGERPLAPLGRRPPNTSNQYPVMPQQKRST